MKKLLKNAASEEELQKELTDYLLQDLFENIQYSVKSFFNYINKNEYLKLSEDEKESMINYHITDITYGTYEEPITWDVIENEIKGLFGDKNIPHEEWKNELIKYRPIWRKTVSDVLHNKEFLETLKEKIDEAAGEKNLTQEGKRKVKKYLVRKAERDSRCSILVEGAKQITEVGLETIKEAYEALNENMTREDVEKTYKKLKSATHSIEYQWEQLNKNSDLF